MRCILFLFFLFSFPLQAEELSIEKAAEPAITWTATPLLPKVNLTNGRYIDAVCDFTVAGAEPLSLTRFYSHLGSDNKAGFWLINPASYAVANFEYGGLKRFVAVGEEGGAVYNYENKEDQSYHFAPTSPEYLGAGSGQTHPLNTHITYHKEWGKKNKQLKERPFSWVGEIRDGAGNVRSFSTPSHFWLRELRESKHKKHPPTEWTPYKLTIVEEKKANGNRLVYTPESICAYNAANVLMGRIELHYTNNILAVSGSDGRKATYTFVKDRIEKVEAAGKIPTTYHYNEKGYLYKVEYPEGRSFTTEYYPENNKVKAQYDGSGTLLGRFEYNDKLTTIYDAENNKTLFHYDENKRITKIERYQGENLFSEEKYCWDPKTGNLLSKNLGGLRTEEYRYDKNHNVIEERLSGEGGSYTLYHTYTDDGLNLKLSETEGSGKITRFTYKPHTNLLTAELVYEGERIRKRKFFTYDESALCIKHIEDDGTHEKPDDLTSVTFRKITYIHPKKSLPCFGFPELIEEKTLDTNGQEILLSTKKFTYHPSGKIEREEICYSSSSPLIIVTTYDEKERPLSRTLDGTITTSYSYDKNDNLLTRTGPRPDKEKRWSYDVANHPIKEEASGLITQKSYDKLGRVNVEIDPCGHATLYSYDVLGQVVKIQYPDGTERNREYDSLGNLHKETDPNGYETSITYDFHGKPLAINYPDGSMETNTYYPDGKVATHRDKRGALTHFTYDLFGNPTTLEIYDTQGELLKTLSSTYSPFSLLSSTNGEAETIYYHYDCAGRKLSEELKERKTIYSYDGAGRVTHIKEGELCTLYFYDNIGNLIAKEVQDDQGHLLRKESYSYDEEGKRIKIENSKGTTTTHYNTLGQVIEIKNPDGTATHITHSYGDHYTKTVTDLMGVKTVLIHDALGKEIEKVVQSNDKVIKRQRKSYDPGGNLTELQEDIYAATQYLHTIVKSWKYGPLGRIERESEGGRVTRYTYHDEGTFRSTVKPDGTELIHTYDGLGRLKRLYSTRGDIDYEYCYNKNDELLTLYDALSKTTTTRTYDPYSNLTQEILGNKNTLKKEYDCQGRRTSTTFPDGNRISYAYQGGELFQVRYGTQEFTYLRDPEGFPTQIQFPIGTLTIKRDSLSNISDYQFTGIHPYYQSTQMHYDKNQNLTYALSTTEKNFTYDPFNQLLSENNTHYSYDSLQNRISKNNQLFAYTPLCELTSPFLYDSNGNLLFDGKLNYTYDSLNRLVTLTQGKRSVHYTYDGFDRRLTKRVYEKTSLREEKAYIWDEMHEIGATRGGRIVELRVTGENDLLYLLSGKTYFPLLDPFNNIVGLVDGSTEKVVESYDYTAFGELPTGSTLSPWGFCGKRVDPESGLIYFGRRYYSPPLGRFLTPDPGEITDSLNPYTFARNNPLKYTDPNGEFGFLSSIVGAIIGAISAGFHSHWKISAIFQGAGIGAAAGFCGNVMGGIGYHLAGNYGVASLLAGGMVGGAGGGAVGGGLSAAAFGGNIWQGIGSGALFGVLSGGASSALIADNIPDALAITGGGALSSYVLDGGKAVGPGALYSFGGALLGNAFTVFGLGTEGVVPKQKSPEWEGMKATSSTYLTTPELSFKKEYNQNYSCGKNAWLYSRTFLIALLGNGYSHVWHTEDEDFSTNPKVNNGYVPEGHYYKLITSGVPYTDQDYALNDFANYHLFRNSCCSRFGYLTPFRYYADYHYPELGIYWRKRR